MADQMTEPKCATRDDLDLLRHLDRLAARAHLDKELGHVFTRAAGSIRALLASIDEITLSARASQPAEDGAARSGVGEDSRRMDAIERGLLRISPDGMDGWIVRAPGTLGGMRQGCVNYGAHRLREAIDASIAARAVPEGSTDARLSAPGSEERNDG